MDETTAASVSPPAKKRGRKRKSELAPNNFEVVPQSPAVINTEEKKIDETPAVSVNPPAKKRGRKRKSELTLDDFEVVPMLDVAETVSRSGRKRKQINYFDLLNPDEFDDGRYLAPKKKETPVKGERKVGRPRKIQPPPGEPELAEPALKDHSTELKEDNNTNTPEKSKNGGEEMDPDASSSESSETPPAPSKTSRSEASVPNADVNKLKKYNKTGETIKMLNNLFTAYQSDANDVEKNANFSGGDKKCKGIAVDPETADESVKMETNSNEVTCGVCKASMSKTLWMHHKYRYHNNLTWKEGEEPLDLSDQTQVMAILQQLYKKKKPFFCQKCGLTKRSVVGYLSHQSVCQKSGEELESVKVECELCGRKILPVSMPSHIKLVHSDKPEDCDVEKKEAKEEGGPFSKRPAKKKALEIIEHVAKNESEHFTTNLEFEAEESAINVLIAELKRDGHIQCKFQYCEFQSDVLEDLTKHFTACEKKPDKGFACRLCLYTRDNIEEVASHMEEAHEVKYDEHYDQPREPEKKHKASMYSFPIPSFVSRSGAVKHQRVLFQNAFKWTYQFHEENCDSELFKSISCSRTEWPILPFDMAVQYLPKLEQSCEVAQHHVTSFNPACLKETFEVKKYDLFEFERHADGKCTIFCGGPVTALAWLPTPFRRTEEDQKIAVAVVNSPDADHMINANYAETCLIQVWSLGRLKNKDQPQCEPLLELGIAFDRGPIWHLEWCPSGCYDDVTLGRMGLLAVAGSDSVVYVYSVPLANRHNNKTGLFYKPKPAIKLYLERPELTKQGMPDGSKYHPVKLSWTKAAGHDHIAVGYTNGYVALFNLNTESIVLKTKDTADVTCIFPKLSFQAHLHAITGLTLHHLCGGARFLLTSSLDRELSIFDLTGSSLSPIWHSKRYLISDAHWMTHWLAILVGTDEASTTSHLSTSLKQVHDHMSDNKMLSLFGSTSTITSITSSDWLNAVIQCNAVGETLGLTVHQLLCPLEHNKVLKKKRMLFGYVRKIEKLKSPEERFKDETSKKKVLLENTSVQRIKGLTNAMTHVSPKVFNNEPLLYHEAQEKYALVFCDNRMKSYNDFTEHSMTELSPLSRACGIVQQNLYPLAQINKASFNPNRQSSLFYATGYQAGFLRISYMEFLKGDPQIK